MAAGCEAQIVVEPLNASDALHMSCEDHVGRALERPKVVHMYVFLIDDAGKKVTATRECHFCATFDVQRVVALHAFR